MASRRHVLTVISPNYVRGAAHISPFGSLPVLGACVRPSATQTAGAARARRGHHQNVQIDINPHARFGINVVSRLGPSANLSRLTRTRILRPPKVGKRKRDATTKMDGQARRRWPDRQPLLRVFTRRSAHPRSLSGLLHSKGRGIEREKREATKAIITDDVD